MGLSRKKIKDGSKSPCCSFGLTLLIIFSLSFAVSSTGCLRETEQPDYLEFRFNATASGPSEIIVPILDCGPVLSRLKVTKGEGEFTIIETIHGKCLKVNFDSSIKVKGRWYLEEPEKRGLMTINLTTMEDNDTRPYNFSRENIPNRRIWINVSYGHIIDFSLSSTMLILDESNFEITYMFRYRSRWNEPLEPGWDHVWADGIAGRT